MSLVVGDLDRRGEPKLQAVDLVTVLLTPLAPGFGALLLFLSFLGPEKTLAFCHPSLELALRLRDLSTDRGRILCRRLLTYLFIVLPPLTVRIQQVFEEVELLICALDLGVQDLEPRQSLKRAQEVLVTGARFELTVGAAALERLGFEIRSERDLRRLRKLKRFVGCQFSTLDGDP